MKRYSRSFVAATLVALLLPLQQLPFTDGSSLASSGSGVLLGAWVGQRNTTTHYESVRNFEKRIGRKLAIDHHYRTWDNQFWGEEAKDVRAGRIPLITWTDWGRTTAAEINSGSQDSLIREKANAIKALNGRVLLRWAPEMAGGLYGIPSAYKSAWSHIRAIFKRRGATNVRWVWSPTAWSFATGEAPKYYPGDGQVDWIAADGYNWYPAAGPWRSLREIFGSFYRWAARRGKPLMIAETGVMEDPARPLRKARWFSQVIPTLQNWPSIEAFVYFHARSPRGFEFWVDTSRASFRSFRRMANLPYMGRG
jgi:hypothetical protein